MSDLIFLDMTDPVRTPDAEFEYLDRLLCEQGLFRSHCLLPAGAEPASTDLYIKRDDDSYVMWLGGDVRYSGGDVGFSALCRQQGMSFESMDEMKSFLRNMDLERGASRAPAAPRARVAATATAAPSDRPTTDRERIEIQSRTRRRIDPAQLARDIGRTVCGQRAAIEEVARWAAASATKTAPARPVCILLAGETGTGKTMLTKGLCEAMNMQLTSEQGRYGYIVVHCNELYEDHMVARLTGAPAGYTGYGDSTILSPVAGNPYQVIVLDEIEKASSKVLDVLMSAMDAGEITLNKAVDGCDTLDLKRAILIFTTNLPLDKPRERGVMGFRADADARDGGGETQWERMERYRDVLVKSGMRREIAARFMSIIKFDALSDDAMIDIMLKSIQDCAAQYGLAIGYVAPEIIQGLYDRVGALRYGARVINYEVEGALGPVFAGCDGDAGGAYDIVGTLGSPQLRAPGGAARSRPVRPGAAPADSGDLDPAALGWEHDAE